MQSQFSDHLHLGHFEAYHSCLSALEGTTTWNGNVHSDFILACSHEAVCRICLWVRTIIALGRVWEMCQKADWHEKGYLEFKNSGIGLCSKLEACVFTERCDYNWASRNIVKPKHYQEDQILDTRKEKERFPILKQCPCMYVCNITSLLRVSFFPVWLYNYFLKVHNFKII